MRDRLARRARKPVCSVRRWGRPRAALPDCWVIDPIDGTKSYVRGVPVWATLLALEVDGEVVVGVVSAPALGRRWWAARGSGAFADGDPIHVSEVGALADAQLCFANFRDWEPLGLGDAMLQLGRQVWRAVGFGDFWGHMLVAEGAAEVMIEPELSWWDVAAVRPIVEEAARRARSHLSGHPTRGPGGVRHDERCCTTPCSVCSRPTPAEVPREQNRGDGRRRHRDVVGEGDRGGR